MPAIFAGPGVPVALQPQYADLLAAAAQTSNGATSTSEVVVVDPSVAGWESLVENLATDSGRSFHVLVIDPAQDGVQQLTTALGAYQDVTAVHILSHGSEGAIRLGTSLITEQTVSQWQSDFASWNAHLAAGADLLFYACDVAGSSDGSRLLETISHWTGDDVAASTNLTGTASLGGDWDLEYRVGRVETQAFVAPEWVGILSATPVAPNLLVSTTGNTSVPAAQGGASWVMGDAVSLGNPNLSLGSGATNGTFTPLGFNLSNFAADGSANLNGFHYVSRAVTVGSANAVNLLPGDLLISGAQTETLGGVAVSANDIALFRPTTPGNYSSGTFSIVLQNPLGSATRDFALVETSTVVGGVTLNAGDFLLTTSNAAYRSNITRYQVIDAGPGTTSGTISTLIDGQSAGIKFLSSQVFGVELVQTTTSIGGVTLSPGQLLISLNAPATVGTNTLGVSQYDVFALTFTGAGTGTSAGSAALLARGSDVGLSVPGEEYDALALVSSNASLPPGINVTGSTFLVAVDNSVVRINSLTGAVVATYPTGLANNGATFGPDGALYVADYYAKKINHYSATGALLSSFNTTGTPQAMAFGPDGNLYVTTSDSTVEKYSPTGTSLGTFITTGSGGLSNAKAIVWGPDGNAYVSSYGNSEVIRYNGTTGAFMNVFATGSGGFEDVTFGPDNNLYVASYGNNAVYRYNGTTGASMGTFISGIATPYGLRFDPAGNLDVSSRSLGQIRTYNGSTGAYINTLVSGLTNPAYMTTTTSLVTTSAGGAANFSVALNSQPTADVVITLTSTMPAQGSLSQSTLTFTAANWNVAQTVTVTGLNDGILNGDQVYQINGIAGSADANYTGASMAPVVVTNREVAVPNTAPVLDPSASPVLAAEIQNAGAPVGAVGTLVSALVDFPGGGGLNNVTDPDAGAQLGIAVTGANTANGTWWYSTDNGSTWNSLGAVSVANARLLAADVGSRLYFQPNASWVGAVPAAITFRAWDKTSGIAGSTANATANGGTTAFSTATDTASLTVSPAPGINVSAISGPTTEAGGAATFTVVLNSQPTADVTIGISSSNTAEGTVSNSSLTFTTANWNVNQIVTVTGVDDFIADGDINYTIVTAPAASSDGAYNNLNANDVAVTNLDNETAGIFVSSISGPTTEAGGTATFSIVLSSMPTANVTIGIASSNPAEGTVSTSSVTFTAANWNVAQIVTVTGVDDFAADGNVSYTIVTAPAVSADLTYLALNPADVAVVNLDNDSPGITVTPTSGLVTRESGATATFTVRLNSAPLLPVTVGLSSSNPAEGVVSVPSLTFNLLNWNVPQTVTLTGVDDLVVDGNIGYTIVTAPATSLDLSYNGLNAADVAVTNFDNDVAGVTVSAISGPTTEAGGTATFTVVLNSQPTADVTIGLNSSNTAEGILSRSTLTFTSANWNVAQTVTVTGVDDFVADGSANYTIVTATAVSADLAYNGLDPTDVAATNLDNEVRPGVFVGPISGPTTESGGEASFLLALDTQPNAPVTIEVVSDRPDEGLVVVARFVFNAVNWIEAGLSWCAASTTRSRMAIKRIGFISSFGPRTLLTTLWP